MRTTAIIKLLACIGNGIWKCVAKFLGWNGGSGGATGKKLEIVLSVGMCDATVTQVTQQHDVT